MSDFKRNDNIEMDTRICQKIVITLLMLLRLIIDKVFFFEEWPFQPNWSCVFKCWSCSKSQLPEESPKYNRVLSSLAGGTQKESIFY